MKTKLVKTKMSNEKVAGVLDTPKEELAPSIWEKDRTLKDPIKRQIYSQIYKVFPEKQVKHVFIIGSITGYKYGKESDVDVTVAISPYDDKVGKTYLTRKINGDTAIGSHRTINYFVTEWRDDTIENFSKVPWGVYSVTENYWISSPGNPNKVRDPQDEYWYELQTAKAILRKFEHYVENWRKDMEDLERMKRRGDNKSALNSQRNEIQMGRNRLKNIIRQLDKERKMAYAWGWGAPREASQNLVFKHVEHSKYSELFKKLRDEVDKENIERASDRQIKKEKIKEKNKNG